MNGWRTICHRMVVAGALALLLGMPSAAARAIEIENVVWGFDGKVVPNQFNPLSVLVFNPSAEPFDGTLTLTKSLYQETRGAALEEELFVSPFARRWVQFYPFVQREHEEWRLAVKPGGFGRRQSYQPQHGTPAHILLEDPAALGRGSKLWSFNEELFPPFSSATAGLASVTLDHQPQNWEPARQQAFLDWLHAGGQLHLLHGAGGRFPKFEGDLAVLNSPLNPLRLGAGTVHRHERTRQQLDREFIDRHIRALAEIQPVDDSQPLDAETASMNFSYSAIYSEVNQALLRNLKGLTRADHNWVVIHLMSIAYLLVIFPGCWLIGRKWRDYRITLGVLLGCMLLFSLGFRQIGRRGYGEATSLHSVAIARPLADGRYDVMQWSNLFVTDGDDYLIAHEGSGRLYSTAQESERVNGVIANGGDGRFLVDIPPYSSREFIARFQAAARPIEISVTSWQAAGGNLQATLTTGAGFPPEPDVMYALYGRQVYGVSRRSGGTLAIGPAVGDLSTFLNSGSAGQFQNFGPYYGQDQRPAAAIFGSMVTPLIARQLGINTYRQAQQFVLPGDRLRLFVLADAPPEFHAAIGASREAARRDGRVLYCLDLFNPREP